MKGCELCRNGARIYCEADGASLCWDCDDKVHSANFLVAKHSRTLLCNVCHSPTPWQASGIKLGPTLSLCHICLHNYTLTKQQHKEEEEEEEDDDFEQGTSTTDHDYSGEEEDDDDDDDEKDGDNQVVPWSSSPPTSPPVATSSTTEDSSSVRISPTATATAGRGVISSLKRSRENSDFDSEDEEIGSRCTRLDQNSNASVMIMSCGALEKEEATSPRSLNPRRPPLALNEPYFQSYLASTPSRNRGLVFKVGGVDDR